MATLDAIRANEANLNIPLYVGNGNGSRPAKEATRSVSEAVAAWDARSREARDALSRYRAAPNGRGLLKNRDGWKRVRFRDVVDNVNATVHNIASEGVSRVVGLEHLDPGELAVTRWGSTDDGTTFTRRFTAGQVLFGKRRAYQRKVGLPDFDGVCSGDIYVFQAKRGRLLDDLLPFVVQSEPFFDYALRTSAGSLSPRTNWRDLKDFAFELPSLMQQREVADQPLGG